METKHYHLELTDYTLGYLRQIVAPGSDAQKALENMRGDDSRIELGMRLLRADYYSAVRDYALEALEKILSGELVDTDALTRWLDESVDGSEWVIYTHKAECVLLVSDQADAYLEETGLNGETVEVRASYALLADIRERLQAEVA